MVELGEDIFLKPVRKGIPTYSGALATWSPTRVRRPSWACSRKPGTARARGQKAAHRRFDVVGSGRMRDWFLGNF